MFIKRYYKPCKAQIESLAFHMLKLNKSTDTFLMCLMHYVYEEYDT